MIMKRILLSVLILLSVSVQAQVRLSFEDAIVMGLENNLAIKISRKTSEVSANNYDKSIGGLLPRVSLSATKSFSEQDVKQQLARDNQVNEINNAKTNNLNISPTLNWTIFDGLGMFHTRDRLRTEMELGSDDLKIQIENNIAQIASAYYRVVLETERLRVFQQALQLSGERVELARTQYEVGRASKLVLLQAQVDYNSDSSALLSQKVLINNGKVNLNQLMGAELNQDYLVSNEFDIDEVLMLNSLLDSAELNNPSVVRAQRSREVNYLQLKELNAQKLPQVSVNFGYSYNDRNSDAGAVLSNTATGINYGIGASWNIFNGFDLKRREQNAKIQIEIADLQIQSLRQSLEADIRRGYVNYSNGLSLASLEELNLEVARENYDIALERYKVGNSNAIELREAQVALVQAEIRKISAEFNVKLAEIELKRLAGKNLRYN